MAENVKVHNAILNPFVPMAAPHKFVNITVELSRRAASIQCRFRVQGLKAGIAWPRPTIDPKFIDGLYRSTCCEIFISCGRRYVEYNFSPSGDWAGFLFSDYRERDVAETSWFSTAVAVEPDSQHDAAYLIATVDLSKTLGRVVNNIENRALMVSPTAVIEIDGQNSYWAVTHHGSKPDFHQASTFTLQL